MNRISDFLFTDFQINTPYYCFNTDIFCERVNMLRRKINGKAKICYSLKSNPWFVEAAHRCCDYIEVCSAGEWKLCLSSGVPSEFLSIGGITKTKSECHEISELVPYRVSVESPCQLDMLEYAAKLQNHKLSILLRLTSGNQFGMPMEQITEIYHNANQYPHLVFKGIHYYPGTQKKNHRDAEQLFKVIHQALLQVPVEEIQFGAGIGATLYVGQSEDEVEGYIDKIAEGITSLAEHHQVTLECGRYLSYPAGSYVTTVLDTKEQAGRKFLIVDGGINHLNYYGQIGGKPIPVIAQLDGKGDSDNQYTICGSLCTVSDILAKDVVLPETAVGDRLMFFNTGAYSVTEARSLFLSRDLPAVVIKSSHGTQVVRKMFSTYPLNYCSRTERNNNNE